MQFTFAHNNFNVRDLDRSLAFYKEAFGLKEVRRMNAPDGRFIIVYLSDGSTPHQLELTWLHDWDKPYNLGDNEFHLAFRVDDFAAALPGTFCSPYCSAASSSPSSSAVMGSILRLYVVPLFAVSVVFFGDLPPRPDFAAGCSAL